jgi:hypothetical protein
VEAAFERIRSAGAKASNGKVSYDLWHRTLTIADIATETATQPPTTVRIANLTASKIGAVSFGAVAADLVEVADIEVGFGIASGGSQVQYTYKLPKLTASEVSGPTQAPQLPAGASSLDLYRFGLAQFARLAAASISIPNLSVGVTSNSAAMPNGEIGYSGITITGIKDGKVTAAKVDKGAIAYNVQVAGKSNGFNGTFANLLVHDFDAAGVAATLDPDQTGGDQSYRVYRQISLDRYEINTGAGPQAAMHMRVDRVVADEVDVKPSRLQLPALIAAIPAAGSTPSPAQARAMLEKAAAIYEGIHVGNFGIDGITVETPQGPVKLAAAHLSLDNGKSNVGIDGLEAQTPQGPFRLGHFALKAIDLAQLIRLSATVQPPAQKPPAEAALGLFQIIEGAEVNDLVTPYKDAKQPLTVDSLAIDWGRFVGPIPTEAHLKAKLVAPVVSGDPVLRPLLAASMSTARIDADLGAGWTETTGAFALDPATIEIAGLGKAQARVVLANVPRALFAAPLQASASLPQVDAGALELTLHDAGLVELLINQYASRQNVSHDAARSAILDAIQSNGAQAEGANPDAAAAVAAISRFVETPQQTLAIKLTPMGKLPAAQLLQLLKSDPMAALAQFKIEASTGP